MQVIDSSVTDGKALSNALQGVYGRVTMSNGIECLYQGQFLHFSGYFDGTQEVIEVPKVSVRIPVVFVGDDFSCMSLVEPDAGFVKVPETARRKKFVILADCVLNTYKREV